MRFDVQKPSLLDEELNLDSCKSTKKKIFQELTDQSEQIGTQASSNTPCIKKIGSITANNMNTGNVNTSDKNSSNVNTSSENASNVNTGNTKTVVNKPLPARKVCKLTEKRDPRLNSSIKKQRHGFPASKITYSEILSTEKRTAPSSCKNCLSQTSYTSDPRLSHKRYMQILHSRCLVCYYPMTDDGARLSLWVKSFCTEDAKQPSNSSIDTSSCSANAPKAKDDSKTSSIARNVGPSNKTNNDITALSQQDTVKFKTNIEPQKEFFVSPCSPGNNATSQKNQPSATTQLAASSIPIETSSLVETIDKKQVISSDDSSYGNFADSSMPTSRQLELLRELLKRPLDSNLLPKRTAALGSRKSPTTDLPSSNISISYDAVDACVSPSKKQLSSGNMISSCASSLDHDKENSKLPTTFSCTPALKESYLKTQDANKDSSSIRKNASLDIVVERVVKKELLESDAHSKSISADVVSTVAIKTEKSNDNQKNVSLASAVLDQNLNNLVKPVTASHLSPKYSESSVSFKSTTSLKDTTSPLSISFKVLSSVELPVPDNEVDSSQEVSSDTSSQTSSKNKQIDNVICAEKAVPTANAGDLVSESSGLVDADNNHSNEAPASHQKVHESELQDAVEKTISLSPTASSADDNPVSPPKVTLCSKSSILNNDFEVLIDDSNETSTGQDKNTSKQKQTDSLTKDSNLLLIDSETFSTKSVEDSPPHAISESQPSFDADDSFDLTDRNYDEPRISFDWFEDDIPTLNVKSSKRKRRHLKAFPLKVSNIEVNPTESHLCDVADNSSVTTDRNISTNEAVFSKKSKVECANENANSLSQSYSTNTIKDGDVRDIVDEALLNRKVKSESKSDLPPGPSVIPSNSNQSKFELYSPMSPIVISDSDDELSLVTSSADIPPLEDSLNESEGMNCRSLQVSPRNASVDFSDDSSRCFFYKDKLYFWPYSSPSIEEIEAMSDDDAEPDHKPDTKDISILPILLEESGYVPKCFLYVSNYVTTRVI